MSEPYTYERQWRPRPMGSPVWQTKEDLFRVLDQYRRWYAEGLSDVEVSAKIRALVLRHNPQDAFKKSRPSVKR